MSKPETKTVLGRVFTLPSHWNAWVCETKVGKIYLYHEDMGRWEATLEVQDPQRSGDQWVEVASGEGPTEADAILALQATLRKMAELEVVE